MIHKPGDQVLIIEDCREGGQAAGQIGVYEGEFPLSVALNDGINWLDGEWLFDDYMSGRSVMPGGAYAKDVYPLWERGTPRPTGPFAMTMDNPRIRLPDGSVIWGIECWWGDADTAPETLEEAQVDLAKTKEFLRGIAAACNAATHPEWELAKETGKGV